MAETKSNLTSRKVVIQILGNPKLAHGREYLITVREHGNLGSKSVRLTETDLGKMVDLSNKWRTK